MTIFYGKRARSVSVFLILLFCVACAQKEADEAGIAHSRGAANNSTMAYEHSVDLETEREQVATVYQLLRDNCTSNSAWQCVILEARIHVGDHASGHLKLRALPAGVAALMALMPTQGDIRQQSTSAEDLAVSIADVDKRLQLLRDYQARLHQLQGHTGADIEDLMKISKELAQTQSDIESLTGEQITLQHRVSTELLTIEIDSPYQRGFWTPVRDSLRKFGGNLAEAISGLITATAFLLPWLLVITAAVWCWLKWRRGRRAKSA